MSWLLAPNKLASVTLPAGPSKTYSFSILTQGSLRRRRFNSSCSFESFFSFTRSCLRATSHSFCDTTLRFSIPWTVLIFGITLDLLFSYKDDERPPPTMTGWGTSFHNSFQHNGDGQTKTIV